MLPPYRLVGVDIAGDWNHPLLANAAALSRTELVFAESPPLDPASVALNDTTECSLEKALHGCRRVIACETTRKSVSLFDLPAPRDPTAILVGNEETGLPRAALKRADTIVSIPLAPTGLSSLNVGVAAAIVLYGLRADLGRKWKARSRLAQRDSDVWIHAPTDPHELGSLLRSVYAFGWRRVFLSDPHEVWFTSDSPTLLQSRAAARRAKNRLTVRPAEELDLSSYDLVLTCHPDRPGQPLSRLQLPQCRRLLVVVSARDPQTELRLPALHLSLDWANREPAPCFRHAGSVLLCVVSKLLTA